MAAVIVSDTSPLRALDFLGQLELLSRVFDRVIVPPAVRDGLQQPRKRFRSINIDQIPRAELKAPSNSVRVHELLQKLQ